MHIKLNTQRLARTTVTAMLGLLLACSGQALAETTQTVDFDSLTDGTQVDTEFSAQGITFVSTLPATGLPVVTNVGAQAFSGANVARSTCYGCEFVTHQVKATFSTLTNRVSLRAGIDEDTCSWDVPMTLEARDPGGTLVDSQTLDVPSSDYSTAMEVTSASNNIASIIVKTSGGGNAGCRFGVDNLSFTQPDVAPAPDFSLSSTTGVAELRQGASVSIPISATRFNGSTGNITFSATGLPLGITASFAPNPLGGLGTAGTLQLTATNTAPLYLTPTTIAVSGAPAIGAGTAARSLNIGLRVVSNWNLSAAPNPILVPSCGTGRSNIYVARAIGFPGTVALSQSGLAPGMTSTITPGTSTPPTSGALATIHELRVTKSGTGGMGDTTMTINSTSGSLPSKSQTLTVRRVAGEVTSFTPTTASAPRDLNLGTEVTINGKGLCPGTRIRFGNMLAEVTPGPMAFGPGGTSVRVNVPRLATSGPITVVSPDGTFSSPGSMTIRTARNVEGFAFENYDHPGNSFADLEATFGAEDTNISVDVCWPFGCDVVTPVPNPLTYLFLAIANGALEDEGSCWGISVATQQLMTGRVPYSRFTPAGATNPFQLTGTAGPDTALRRHIRRWHVVQLSSEFIQTYINRAASNPVRGVGAIRSDIRSELLAGRNPILALRKGGGGHVVVVHDLRDIAGGGFELDVYDSNVPYTSDDEASDGSVHADRMSRSTVTMTAGGTWTHRGAYSGGAWSGGLSSFIQVPFGDIPRDPTLPTSVSGLLSLIVPFAEGGEVTQIRDLAGHTLLNADGTANTNAATAIPGATVFNGISGTGTNPVYMIPASTPVVGEFNTKAGTTYGQGMVGPGFGVKVTGLEGTGTTDTFGFNAKTGAVDLNTDAAPGNMNVMIARQEADGDQRAASINVTGADAGDHHIALSKSKGGLVFTADGSAEVDATITWAGKHGTPGSANLPAVHLDAGETLSVAPALWNRLGNTKVLMTVRNSNGNVESIKTIKTTRQAKNWVKSTTVNAKTRNAKTRDANARQITVKTRYEAMPANAIVVQVVEVRRGSKLIKRKMRKMTAAQARNHRTWKLKLNLRDGSYTIRTGTTVLLPQQATLASTKNATVAFRAL